MLKPMQPRVECNRRALGRRVLNSPPSAAAKPAATPNSVHVPPMTVEAVEAGIKASSPGLLLSPSDVAALLGVSRRTLDGWRMTGEGPPFVKVSPQIIRYRADALAQFIDERTRRNTAQ